MGVDELRGIAHDVGQAATRRLLVILEALGDGGTERVTLNLAEGLVGRGYRVDLLVLSRAGRGHAVPPGLGAWLADLPSGGSRSVWLVRALLLLRRALRDASDDTIVLTAMLRINWLVGLARRLARRQMPAVAVEHTLYGQIARDTSAARAALNLWLRRTLFREFDAVIVPSRAGADALARELRVAPEAVTALPNAVVGPMTPLGERRPRDVPLILAVGRLHPQKDYGTLIEAFARLAARRRARLRILGEGEQRAELERHVARHGLGASVELAGFVADPTQAYREADLLVLASKWEVLPTVLIEAMHHGCPVVATDCEYGPREILDGGRLGALVPVGDVAALAAAMEGALDGPAEREALRRRAADYGIERASAAYDAFFARLPTRRPAPTPV